MLKNTPEITNVKTRDEFVQVVKDWFDLMVDDTKKGKKWIYSNSQNKTSYVEARKDKTPSLSLAKKISDFLMKVAQQKNIPKELFTIENIFFTEHANKMFERSDIWNR